MQRPDLKTVPSDAGAGRRNVDQREAVCLKGAGCSSFILAAARPRTPVVEDVLGRTVSRPAWLWHPCLSASALGAPAASCEWHIGGVRVLWPGGRDGHPVGLRVVVHRGVRSQFLFDAVLRCPPPDSALSMRREVRVVRSPVVLPSIGQLFVERLDGASWFGKVSCRLLCSDRSRRLRAS